MSVIWRTRVLPTVPAMLLMVAASLLQGAEGNQESTPELAPAASPQADTTVSTSLPLPSLEELTKVNVTTAALHQQEIKRAPGDITVVTADEIERYGWRTLGEIINHVRGFYVTYDRTYQEAGTAGFSIPGDWSTRILVLVDGHNMTENIFGAASFFYEDFAVDMTLVDRIEIVRGASSSLYGSNGLLATINIITRRPGRSQGIAVRADAGTSGQKRGTLTGSWQISGGTSLLSSATVFNDGGQRDIYFPEYSAPSTNNGNAVHMDGDRGYRFFTDVVAGSWEILAFGGTRLKVQPISWADTIFNNPGTRAIDHRAAIVATWTHKFGEKRSLSWANAWDQYTYNGIYLYPLANDDVTGASGIETVKEHDAGQWLTSTITFRLPFLRGDLTTGGEGKVDLRAMLSGADVLTLDQNPPVSGKPDRSAAGFIQQEWHLGKRWDFTVGSRYDWSYYRSNAMSPRGAIVFQATPRTTLKLIYGRGFRNPNEDELFLAVPGQNTANPALKPEQANSLGATSIATSANAGRQVYPPIELSINKSSFRVTRPTERLNSSTRHIFTVSG